jgi:hypothetical protein
MPARIRCKSCGVTNELPVKEADGDVLLCDSCGHPLKGPESRAPLRLEDFFDRMSELSIGWEEGILTKAEVESGISAAARAWLVKQGWITSEMDEDIESRLIRIGPA